MESGLHLHTASLLPCDCRHDFIYSRALKNTAGNRAAGAFLMNKELAEKGRKRIEWAKSHMKVLGIAGEGIKKRGKLKGLKIGMALHVEAKTACLALALRDAGAEVRLASCNPLSTDDSVSEALNSVYGLPTFARKGETSEEYYRNLGSVLEMGPDIVIDDGADLITLLHLERQDLIAHVIGGNEETTTGVIRLRSMEAEGKLLFPVVAVNDSYMKYLFDNRYGTGQSTLDGVMAATNLLLAGKSIVVAGYGWCGRGIANKVRGMGGVVTVTEVDPIKAIEAIMDGFTVGKMADVIADADFVLTATGDRDIVTYETALKAKDGCVMANAGHFNLEIDVETMRSKAKVNTVREYVEEFNFENGKRIYILAEGRLVNLAAGQGHPAEIMDMSFTMQALAAEYLATERTKLKPGVHILPRKLDTEIAVMKLKTLGVKIDKLTEKQKNYLASWNEGT